MSRNLLQNQWQRLTEPAIRRLQAEQLRRYLRTVVLPFSAHYRKLFQEHALDAGSFRTLEDLQWLPFTTKSDLLNTAAQPQRFRDFILVPDQKTLARRPGTVLRAIVRGREQVKRGFEAEFRPIFATFTTGRSAEPTPLFFTQRDLTHLATAGRRVVEICAARPEDRMLNILPFAPHLAFWLAHYAGTAGGILTLSSGGGKVMGTDGNIRHIRKFKPDMRDLALELGAPKMDVLATYGFTEAKLAWSECPFPHDQASSGYHLYPDLGILEIIDPKTGAILPPGRPGEIVFTPLDARGTVVLRYRTGDYTDGGLTYEPCPHCGRSVPRLLGNISRSSEIKQMNFDKIKGTLVDFNELEHVLDDAPNIGAWQMELRKRNNDPLEVDELILHLQKLNGADEDQLRRELSERCVTHLEIHPNRIMFHDTDEIRELQGVGTLLKEQKLVDHRPAVQSVARPVSGAVAGNKMEQSP